MTADPATVVGLVALMAVAAFVNGTIGFGFALLAVNALAAVLSAKEGVILTSVIAPIVSGLQVVHHRERVGLAGRLRTMIVGGLVGTAIGTELLVLLPGAAISAALGVFTIAYVVDSVRRERPPLDRGVQRWLGPFAGLVGGVSNGALGASGPVFGTYLTAIGLRGRDFAFAISMAFFSMSLVRNGLLFALGQYTVAIVLLGLALALPAIAGQQLGFWFKGRLPARALYHGVLVVLLVAGVNLLLRAAGVTGVRPV